MKKRIGGFLLAVLMMAALCIPALSVPEQPAYQIKAGETLDLTPGTMSGSGFSFLVTAPEGTSLTVTLRDSSQNLGGEPYYLTYHTEVAASSAAQRVAFLYTETAEQNVIYPRLNQLYMQMQITSTGDVTISDLSDFELGVLSGEDRSGLFRTFTPPDEPLGVRGDADLDGKVTVSDALTVLRAAVGLTNLSGPGRTLANLDRPELDEITVLDALLVLRLAVGLGA